MQPPFDTAQPHATPLSWWRPALIALALAVANAQVPAQVPVLQPPGTEASSTAAPAIEAPAAEAPQAAQPGSRLLEVRQALDTRLAELATVARDYAHWDEAYDFVTGEQQRFPGEGLLAPALARLDIHYMLVLDRRLQPRLSVSVSAPPPRQAAVPASPELIEALQRAIDAGELNRRRQNLGGLMAADEDYLLVTARPVLRERQAGSPGGWLLFARRLDNAALDELLHAIEPAARSLYGEALHSAQLPSAVRAWLDAPTPDMPLFQHASGTHMTTWLTLRDLAGRALWAASLDTPLAPGMRAAPAVAATPLTNAPRDEMRGSGWLAGLLTLLAAAGALWAWRRYHGTAHLPRVASPKHAAQALDPPVQATATSTSVSSTAIAPAAESAPQTAMVAAVAQQVAADQIIVFYQPISDLHSHRVCALEARPLWLDASRGWILPTDPLLIAGPGGESLDVAQFVVGQVARDLRAWREQGLTPVPISVNVAASTEHRDRLRHTLQHLADEDDLRAGLLQLEIADELLVDHATGELRPGILPLWRELGLPLVIDHAGARARALPALEPSNVHALKLDTSLAPHIATDSIEGRAAGAILRKAQELGISVIATGVNRWSQVEALRALGCRQVQGPLLALPAGAAHAARFLRDGHIDMRRVHDPLSDTDELPVLRMPQP